MKIGPHVHPERVVGVHAWTRNPAVAAGQRALLAAQSELSPEEREATQREDDAIEDLDAINGFWDGDYGSDSSDSDYIVTTPPPRANDAEAGGSNSAQPDPAAAQAPVSPAAPTTTDLMQMMINMQTQFNERMLKLQEEAVVREECNMFVIHAIQQQQERTNQEWREIESLRH